MEFIQSISTEVWIALFTFLTAAVGLGKLLLDKVFKFIELYQLRKVNNEKTVERLKAEYGATILAGLKTTVDQLKPIVETHSMELKSFKGDVAEVKKMQNVIREVLQEVILIAGKISSYYQESQNNIEKARAGGNIITDRLAAVETKVNHLGKVILKK